MPFNSNRTRLTTTQEQFLIDLDKNVRATHYQDPQDQRAFLDRQAGLVVRIYSNIPSL